MHMNSFLISMGLIGVHLRKLVCGFGLLRDLLHSVMCFLFYQYVVHYHSAMSETCSTNERSYELSVLNEAEFACIYTIIFSNMWLHGSIWNQKKNVFGISFCFWKVHQVGFTKKTGHLKCNFKRCLLMNVVLSIKKSCIFFHPFVEVTLTLGQI